MVNLRLSGSTSLFAIATGLLFAVPAHAEGQTAPLTAQDSVQPAEVGEVADDDDTIVVLGARLLGQVETAQPPLLELDAEDIAAYGAGSIDELLQQLSPQVSSARGRGDGGRPVMLVNGVRISSFREMRSYPPEAIAKVEVFPEEVALQYGYSADQRVVNIVLKDNFSSREVEAEYGQPWAGGYSTQQVEATYLRIDGRSRFNANIDWNNSSVLTEAERGVVQASDPDLGTDPDPALYRSLVADTASLEGTLNWTMNLGNGNSLSVNGTYERDDTLRLQGLDTVTLTDPAGNSLLRSFNEADPLTVDTRSQTWSSGATLNLGVGDWQVTGTLDGAYGHSRSQTANRVDTSDLVAAAAAGTLALDADLGTFADAGYEEALTDTYTIDSKLTARSTPVYLPGGDLSVALDAGYKWNRIDSMDTRNGGLDTRLSRGRLSGGVNLGVPITSRDEDFLGFIGDITLNLGAGVDELSDFGTLYDWTAGLTWGLTDSLSVNATYINRDTAPTLSQLGNAEVSTPNVSTYDLANGETVLATIITGGNPNLPVQNQSDWKFGVVWELPFLERSNISVDYMANHSTDVAAAFPLLTPAIEAAFPDRVVRDASGTLVSIDQRPISFARQTERKLQFGLNLSGQIAGNSDSSASAGTRGGAGAGAPVAMAGGSAGSNAGGPAAGGATSVMGPDAERFARMRATFCEGDAETLRAQMNDQLADDTLPAAAETPREGMPIRMLQRIAGEDGVIDEAEFAAMRERICSSDGPPRLGGGQMAGGPPPAGASGGPGAGGPRIPFGPGGGRGGNGGRWFVNLQYNLELENKVLIADGVPELDLLHGDTLSSGGQPRHTASLRLGTFYNGFGMFWNAAYTGSSTVEGSDLPGSTDLSFDDYVTFSVRMFADLGRREKLVEAVPFLAGSRIGFDIDNIFDTRQRVTDSTGTVPIRYQPYLIDPVGRSFEIEFRKLF